MSKVKSHVFMYFFLHTFHLFFHLLPYVLSIWTTSVSAGFESARQSARSE